MVNTGGRSIYSHTSGRGRHTPQGRGSPRGASSNGGGRGRHSPQGRGSPRGAASSGGGRGRHIRKIEEARRKIVDKSSTIPDFGAKASSIAQSALDEFSRSAPSADDSAAISAAYARKLVELEASLDAHLEVLYLRQLALLREQALAQYRGASKTSDASDYEAVLAADALFLRNA